MYATSIILVLATPVLAITLALMALERLFRRRHFRSGDSAATRFFSSTFSGSTPIPAVYIMILPGMGVVSELITCFSRKTDFRIQLRGLFEPRDRVARVFWSGDTTCLSAANPCMRDLIFSAPEFSGGDSFGDQSVQLDGDSL